MKPTDKGLCASCDTEIKAANDGKWVNWPAIVVIADLAREGAIDAMKAGKKVPKKGPKQ